MVHSFHKAYMKHMHAVKQRIRFKKQSQLLSIIICSDAWKSKEKTLNDGYNTRVYSEEGALLIF